MAPGGHPDADSEVVPRAPPAGGRGDRRTGGHVVTRRVRRLGAALGLVVLAACSGADHFPDPDRGPTLESLGFPEPPVELAMVGCQLGTSGDTASGGLAYRARADAGAVADAFAEAGPARAREVVDRPGPPEVTGPGTAIEVDAHRELVVFPVEGGVEVWATLEEVTDPVSCDGSHAGADDR